MAVPVLALATPAGAAAGGNSANAKACQNNGWQTQLRIDGTGFTNQGDCVSYGAQGGKYAACYDSVVAGFNDFSLTKPIGTLNNATFYNSSDGSCSGGVFEVLTQVSAANEAAASAACQALGFSPLVASAAASGFTTAPNFWLCF